MGLSKLFSIGLLFISLHIQADAPVSVAKPVHILFLVNGDVDSSFWSRTLSFSNEVAKQLNVQLTTKVIGVEFRNRFLYSVYLNEYIEKNGKPDYVIGPLDYKGGNRLLSELATIGVPYFSINSVLDFNTEDSPIAPRNSSPWWIGHISPDDYSASYDQANMLLREPCNVIMLAGRRFDSVSVSRLQGFNQAITESECDFSRTYYTNWDSITSARAIKDALRKGFSFNTLLTVTESQALAATALLDQQTVAIGTFDWSEAVLTAIKQDQVSVSFGGHFIEAGRAIVHLFDYHQGIDFSDKYGTVIQTKLHPVTRQNIENYYEWMTEEGWRATDFRQFSEFYSAGEAKTLTIDNIINESN